MFIELNSETEEGCKSCFTEVKKSNFYYSIAGTLRPKFGGTFCGRCRGSTNTYSFSKEFTIKLENNLPRLK